ncbi:MAG: LysR family transcriptional regulator [Proteobacteria bacterium]|nr:LysR family transcriptional regulator [Pseudomonadota bacterium]
MTKKISKNFHYKNNRFQQLRGFCYTVQSGSMSAAAKKMGLTQGAVSLQIQSLERDLEVQLFKRDKNKASLTREGRMFYAHSVPHIYGTDEMFEDFISNLKNEKSKTIRIASSNVCICHILPKYIKNFEKKFPETKFEIKNFTKDQAIKDLLSKKVDMLLYSMQLSEIPSELDFIPIVEYQPILLTKKNHPLAKKKKVTMADIKKYKLLRLDKKFVTIPNFDEVAKHYGLKTKIEFEMANYEILKKFIKEDVGIGILSSICLEGEEVVEFASKSLANYFPKILYGILIKNGKNPQGLLKDFIEMMKSGKLLKAQLEQI